MADFVVPLPPMNAAQIPLPAAPSFPATLEDITNAAKFLHDLRDNKVPVGKATDDDLTHALVYVHCLCDSYSRQGDTAVPSVAYIRAIVAELITEAFVPINEKLNKKIRMSAQAFNSGCGSGKNRNYQVIPFIDAKGNEEDPAIYNLPYLKTIDDINALNQGDLHTYMDRYVVPRSGNAGREVKLQSLRAFLGCSVDE